MSQQSRLKANSIGAFGQFFQAMAHIAPAIGVVLNAQLMASRAGPALPLASLFAMILALGLAYCLGLLTRKYYGASGYFQIHSRALGPGIGFITSWLFFLYEPFNAFLNLFGFGAIILEPFSESLGFHIPWWVTAIVGNIIITALSLANIKRNIRSAAILGGIEFLIFLALGILLVVKADHPWQPQFFAPSSSPDGIGGLLYASIFGFIAFVGYESGLPLAEETRNAKKSTFKGIVGSVLLVGVFYVFVNYATVIGFGGGGNPVAFAKAFNDAQNPYGANLGIKAFGALGAWLVLLATLNSTLGCCLAGQNASTRVLFGLGRAGILPKQLGKVSRGTQVPANAVWLSSLLTFALILGSAFLVDKAGELDWYGLIGVMMVLPLLIIHLMTCVSVFVAYRRKESGDFHVLHHGIIPFVTGLLVLLPIWGSVYYNLTPPISYAPWIVLAWFIIGIAVYVALKKRRPESLRSLEREMNRLESS